MEKKEIYVPNDEKILMPEDERFLKIEKKLEEVNKKYEENSFALEMLQDKKRTIRYMFVIILILIIALVGTNIGWLLYESQFETVVEDETTQYVEDIDNPTNSNFSQIIN